jgi:endonuclease YncB( thermonuclease family)
VRLAYGDQATDRYGRTLAYVFFQMSEDQFGKKACVPFPKKGRPPLQKEYMLNRVLVQCGYAYAFTRFPFALEREFVQLQREAEARERGLWKPDSKHRALAAVPETKSPRPKGDLEE